MTATEVRTELRATVVRVGARVLLIPEGQPIPEGVVLGKATPDAVYRTFYEATHCPRGHLRGEGRTAGVCSWGQNCHNALTTGHGPEWTWGAPA